MITKTVNYEDFNGVTQTETLYFNLTKAELTKLELGSEVPLSTTIKEAVESGDNAKLLAVFDKVIMEAYGIKSEDGKRFIKNPTIKEEFAQSAAYSEMFIALATEPGAAEAFIQGLVK